MKKSTIALLALLLAAGCVSKETEDKAHVQTQKLAAPSEVRAERQGKDVLITWTDNSVDEAGFTVYYKKGPFCRSFSALPKRMRQAC